MKELETLPETSAPAAACHDTGQTASLSSPPALAKPIAHAMLRIVLPLILCLTVLAVFVPLDPSMPAPGLDTSWMFAMNQAVAQRLVFGRDIIFTFGPYASIYTELYHPATDGLMIWGSSFLGLAYFALLLLLGKGQKLYAPILYGLFLAALLNSRDALLFSYPLMLALVVYRMTLPDGHPVKLRLAEPFENGVAILFAPLGLLPLIKGSLLPICALTAALCCGLLWRRGKKSLACMAMAATAISCMLLWAAAKQPVMSLPGFFWSTKQIISGYTEAMAFPGDPWECVLYILASALILLVVAWTAHRPGASGWFLGTSCALFLFTAFKGGFVRHDPWHNGTAASSILAAAILLIFVLGERRALLPIVMAALVWTYVSHKTVQVVADDVSRNFRGTFERAYGGARIRLTDGELKKEYGQHIAAIHTEFPIARMPGTTDIYSFNQAWILASENTWAPRPVVQSYSAYTPELARLNLLHLENASAPDNIIFRVEPIDGRLPALEDGLSWPALINGYSLMKLDPQAAYLRKRTPAQRSFPAMASDVSTAGHEFGEEVSLPDVNEPLFARLEITPTVLGRILGTFFKPPQLYLSVQLLDGRTITYRALSNMMKSDFLISPLVRNTEQFALLAAGGNTYLTGNRVKSISISSDDGKGLFWNSGYSLKLITFDLLKNTEAENSILFDKINDGAPASASRPSTIKCEGSIESLNGSPPSSGITNVEATLSLNGWMSVAAKDGLAADSVFVLLTSVSGKSLYVKTRSTPREDVKRHFHQPSMPDPGYAALIDVSGLKGSYMLGLARAYQGNLGVCQQFRLPLLINP